jgi:catechol 2,3-dioxygenase-like lactoylglutathione lyase family enzyme
MANPSATRANLLVLYTSRLDQCHRFYCDLGLVFAAEQHGPGPRHYAAVLADGTVFELYPARPGRQTGFLRLGFCVEGKVAAPPLAAGRHLFTDPDGRTVDIQAV